MFTSSGTYLNLTKQTDAQGQVSFELSDGSYKFRADYRGYQFWSAVSAVPGTLSGVLAIPHQDVTITVSEVYQSSAAPLEGIKAYLFTAGGAYQNTSATTNAQGQVSFSLPQKDYKVRADYLSGQYWSPVFNAQNTAIDIAHAYANVQVSEHGSAVNNAPVYLFTNTGTYLGRMLRTDAAGLARFKIPSKAYKFRVDCNSRQYWSDVVNLLANEETTVSLQLNLLALNPTNDPAPVRWDGIPPKLEQKPKLEKKRVLLASLFEISGILANGVVGQLSPEGGIYYYISDHLGTPQKIMDQGGAVVWSAVHSPFGKATLHAEGITNNLRLPGQYLDQETGLHYNYYRYYDPRIGRYLTPDPIGLTGGINPFVYVLNNPITLVDPLGLDVTIIQYQGLHRNPFGHIALSVNGSVPVGFDTLQGTYDFLALMTIKVPGAVKPITDSNRPIIDSITIKTTPEADLKVLQYITGRTLEPGLFDLTERNCSQFAADSLRAGGVQVPFKISPRQLMSDLHSIYDPKEPLPPSTAIPIGPGVWYNPLPF